MRNVMKLILCVLMLVVVSPVAADTHYVSSGESIQAAIDASAPGDEIEVAPGTYNEAIDFKGKAIRLYSSGGPDMTTIDASGLDSSVVTCESGENANTILEGFTITGGNAINGGGMFITGSSPTVTNCIFASNNASRGGGMLNDQNSNPTVTNCIFASNWGEYGGGMYNAYGSNSTVTNCTFNDNDGRWFGGGMLNGYASNSTVTNCTFTSNWGDKGGGMFNGQSSPMVTNCTFSNNYCTTLGNGMYSQDDSNPTVTNCILWGYSPPQIVNVDSTASVTYSDVQGGWPGTGNINLDPMFADADGRLLPGSPCIDAGDNSVVTVTTDLDGNHRTIGLAVDMGAYEFQEPLQHAAAKTQQLIDKLVALELPAGIENSLVSKLKNAIDSIQKAQEKAAVNKLEAFINEVEAQRGKKIPEADADTLIALAQAIIDLLEAG